MNTWAWLVPIAVAILGWRITAKRRRDDRRSEVLIEPAPGSTIRESTR